MHFRISHPVHIFHVVSKMTAQNKTRSPKLEKDLRPPLFSTNCPIRCGTSGYSYKRSVDIS
jgi:hypothetical protein